MALHGSPAFSMTYNGVTIHDSVTNGLTASDMAQLVETTTLGDEWPDHSPTGQGMHEDFPLEGNFDPTSNLHAQLSVVDRTPGTPGAPIVMTFGGGVTYTVHVLRKDWKVSVGVDGLTKFHAVLRPRGAVAWGS